MHHAYKDGVSHKTFTTMTLNHKFFVDGVASARLGHFTFDDLKYTTFRPWLSLIFDQLRTWTINDRVRCHRYVDGMPHDIALHMCGRVIRYDVNTDTFSGTDTLESNGEFKVYIDDGNKKDDFIKFIMFPYLHGFYYGFK